MYKGNEAIVKVLLENRAEVNAMGGKYGNALQAASYKGNEAIVKVVGLRAMGSGRHVSSSRARLFIYFTFLSFLLSCQLYHLDTEDCTYHSVSTIL